LRARISSVCAALAEELAAWIAESFELQGH
jgi:hypothetical protein